MKNDFLKHLALTCLSVYAVLFWSCTNQDSRIENAHSADYYKNLFTGEILDKSEFQKFRDSLLVMVANSEDSLDTSFTTFFYDFINQDSTIQEFKYSIRIGNEYLIREGSYEKIGMTVPLRTFLTIDGDSVQIGGKQSKPTLINLWFVGCKGCEEEMPSLNFLQQKYADDVNFIAMTFDKEKRVTNFLNKKEFNFKHIIEVDDEYIKNIGTSPYPENIFISKVGEIVYIEGGIPYNSDDKSNLQYFESLIEKLL